MDVQTVYNEVTQFDPEYAIKLGQALKMVAESGFFSLLKEQTDTPLLNGGLSDSDAQILQQVREARWEKAVYAQLEIALLELKVKELSDES